MTEILSAANYPSVRAKLDVTFDATDVPDDVLGDDGYMGAAEDWIEAKLQPGGYDALSPADQRLAKRAAIIYWASLVAPFIPSLTGETMQGVAGYTQDAVDWDQRARQLASEALAALPSAALRPSYGSLTFRVGHGGQRAGTGPIVAARDDGGRWSP